MDFVQALVLGVIQGLTEWLPVSSEAMVTLAGRFLFNLSYPDALANAIWLHIGSVAAALVYFRKDIFEMAHALLNKKGKNRLLLFLATATLASAGVALPLLFLAFNLRIADGLFTLLIGLFLVALGLLPKKIAPFTRTELPLKNAAATGLVQGFAALPGISRSGITVAALLAQKYALSQAFRLSFLMSIPVSLGAQVALPLVYGAFVLTPMHVFSGLVAAVVGLASIHALMKLAETLNFSKAVLVLGVFVLLLGILLML